MDLTFILILILVLCVIIYLFRRGWKLGKDREIGGLRAGMTAISYNWWFNPHPFRFIRESAKIKFGGSKDYFLKYPKEKIISILDAKINKDAPKIFIDCGLEDLYKDLLVQFKQIVSIEKSKNKILDIVQLSLKKFEDNKHLNKDSRQNIGIEIGILLNDIGINDSGEILYKWI